MNKILIFDFDGTIADTLEAGVRIYNDIARDDGYRPITKDILPKLRGMSAMDNVRFMGVPMLKLPFIARKVRAAIKREIPNLRMFPGLKDQLAALKAKGYSMYVVSSNSKENIQAFLDNNQVTAFDGVYSVSGLFGKHAKIKSMVKTSGWDPTSVFYVGDEVRDIDAARKAGVNSVSVAWGYNTHAVLSASKPDFIMTEPAGLSSL